MTTSRQKLQTVRDFYRSHPSMHAALVWKALESTVLKWNKQGENATLLVAGSVGFGQSSSSLTEDVDLIYLGPDTVGFRKRVESGEIVKALRSGLLFFGNITYLDYKEIDMRCVEARVNKLAHNIPYPEHLIAEYAGDPFTYYFEEFLKFYWMGCPLDARFEELFNLGLQVHPVLAEQLLNARLGHGTHLTPKDFRKSFETYHQRLRSKFVFVPQRILELEEQLL